MLAYSSLSDDQRKLYDGLKKDMEDKKVMFVKSSLEPIGKQDLSDIFNAEDQKLFDLLDYTNYGCREIARTVLRAFVRVDLQKSFVDHLFNKMNNAAQLGKTSVVVNILGFVSTNDLLKDFSDHQKEQTETIKQKMRDAWY